MANNRSTKSREKDSYKLEYSEGVELGKSERGIVAIPSSVILADNSLPLDNQDKLRVAMYAYFASYVGVNNKVSYSVKGITELFLHDTLNRNKVSINKKVRSSIEGMYANGYIHGDAMKKSDSCINLASCDLFDAMNDAKVDETASDEDEKPKTSYALIYSDEIDKIMSYVPKKRVSIGLHDSTMLNVFAVLRMRIFRRNIRIYSYNEDLSSMERIGLWPEVGYGYYRRLAEQIGISERAFSYYMDILKNELKLIYWERMLSFVDGYGNLHSGLVVYANYQKRFGNMMYRDEKSKYAETEVRAGIKNIVAYGKPRKNMDVE